MRFGFFNSAVKLIGKDCGSLVDWSVICGYIYGCGFDSVRCGGPSLYHTERTNITVCNFRGGISERIRLREKPRPRSRYCQEER